MEIIKYYENYTEFKKSLQNKSHNLSDDSVGQYNFNGYSADITVRDYDGVWRIDYDVYYRTESSAAYLDGGSVCDVVNMPETDEDFWKFVKDKVEEHIKR